MLPRQRMFGVLNHERADRVPFEFSLTEALAQRARAEFGNVRIPVHFDFDMRGVGLERTKRDIKAELKPFIDVDAAGLILKNEWGMLRRPGTFHHFTEPFFPLKGATIEQIAAWPVPDYKESYRWVGVDDAVKSVQERGYFANAGVGHIFEIAWQWRGMEDFLVELLTEDDAAQLILDKITSLQVVAAEGFAAAGVDMIRVGDDVGTQKDMMMSPDLWRKWLKPRLAQVIGAAKAVKPDVHIWYHSDGVIHPIIPDLIEIGVDILNPIQPECLDPLWVKKTYGHALTLWGTIGTQTTMPFGTPQDVRNCVAERVDQLGKDGGLVLAPTHILEPDVPWENVLAFVEACRAAS